MREIKGRNGGTLKVMEKGETLNPAGRVPGLVTQLKRMGYPKSHIIETILICLGMPIDELQRIKDDTKYTSLERTVAAAIIKGFNNSSLYALETLLSRAIGKPTETIDQTTTLQGEIKVTLQLDNNNIQEAEINKLPEGDTG